MTAGSAQLAALKEAGYKVTVTHQRRFDALPVKSDSSVIIPEWNYQINARGGTTRVEITWLEKPEEVLATGIAYCCDRDNYDRKLGLTIAIGRARKALESGKL